MFCICVASQSELMASLSTPNANSFDNDTQTLNLCVLHNCIVNEKYQCVSRAINTHLYTENRRSIALERKATNIKYCHVAAASRFKVKRIPNSNTPRIFSIYYMHAYLRSTTHLHRTRTCKMYVSSRTIYVRT